MPLPSEQLAHQSYHKIVEGFFAPDQSVDQSASTFE